MRRGVQGRATRRQHDGHSNGVDTRCGRCWLVEETLFLMVVQYTPEDTLVFGGNFLHSYNVPIRECLFLSDTVLLMRSIELKVREIEINTHVPKKFRFPYFVRCVYSAPSLYLYSCHSRLCWYAAEKYLRDLKAKEEFSPRVLESVEALANFLVAEARAIERGNDHAKRESKEQVPNDRVKDAPALARELRWRVRLARGESSDDEGRGHRKTIKSNGSVDSLSNGAGTKRKRSLVAEDTAMFRNFKPRQWERVINEPVHCESRVVKARRPAPNGEDWKTRWAEWTGDGDEKDEEGAQEAQVERRKDVIVKVRKTERGIERQRVERVMEMWVWEGVGEEADAKAPVVLVKEGGDVDMADPPTVIPVGGGSVDKREDSAGHPNVHGLDVAGPDDPMPQDEPCTAVA